jgi:glycine cleavage system H protein
MSHIPADLLYTSDDEWIRIDGEQGTVGITDYAQDALSDIVYVELSDAGDSMAAGEVLGVVESVKAAADLFMPISGEIVEVNEDLPDMPEILNSDPYDDGWLVKLTVSDSKELEGLMDATAYAAFCDERG